MNSPGFPRWFGVAVAAVLCVFSAVSRADDRAPLFNDNWKFVRLPDRNRGAAPIVPKLEQVTLPHDWSIEGPFDQSLASCQAYLPGGVGLYTKIFDVPNDWQGKHIAIRFDGVYRNSQVQINNHDLGLRPSGYVSFSYDLTPYLMFGAKNNLGVRVDHSDVADSRWYSGSGIYRNVWLVVTDNLHVGTDGTFVDPQHVTSASADVALHTTVTNDGGNNRAFTLLSIIKDAKGTEIARAQSDDSAGPKSSKTIDQTIPVQNPTLWSIENPAMYELVTQVKSGDKVIDEYHTPFGMRHLDFDPNRGLKLNGVSMKMKGVCLHGDAGALGAAVPAEVWQRRLAELKECGCNAIRTSHNPPAPEFLDLCDRMGFVVMDEAFDEWSLGKKKWTNGHNKGQFSTVGYASDFDKWSQTDLHDMILRDRNHPSIIMWSIGNEIDFPNDAYPPGSPELPPIADKLIGVVKSLDTSRPVTAACADIEHNPFADKLDIVGYNYQEARYSDDHAKYPNRFIFGSENKHDAAAWRAVASNDFISGQFLWTGIDYLGETPGWPSHGANFGLLDVAGFKKPEFYYRKSLWVDDPMVFINPTGTRVQCYSNCQKVELFQDDKSLGEKTVPENHTLYWPIDFKTGVLKAVGKNDDKQAATWEIHVAGPAAKLTMKPEVTTLSAANHGVGQIEVQISDSEGNRSLTAKDLVHVKLEGPARILGLDSGDLNNDDTPTRTQEKAYLGRMIIYFQPTGAPGQITVGCDADGLTRAQSIIDAK